MLLVDELKLFRGEDLPISKHICIHQPSLYEISQMGELEYYSMLYNLTATPQSLKGQLWNLGFDYTQISQYELFYALLYKMYTQEQTAILFGDLDLCKFQLVQDCENNSYVLKQYIDDEEVIFDEFTYMLVVDSLRKMHFIAKDEQMPANESTKMILIEDALMDLQKKQKDNTDHSSQLKNLISTMVNSNGFKYGHSDVWDMKIYAFMDSVKRISKIKNADLLMQSGYSGFGINLKDIKDKKQLDWLGELE